MTANENRTFQNNISQAVILAGGRGERLRPFTDAAPKPMFPIGGDPFICKLLRQVKDFGIERVVLLLGYKHEVVTEALGDGSEFGLEISCRITPPEYDTAERLTEAVSELDDDFLLMYSDNYCPVDFARLQKEYFENQALLQLSVYSNKDGYTKSNMIVDERGRVIVYDKTRKTPGLRGVEIGYMLVSKEAVIRYPDCKSFSEVISRAVAENDTQVTENVTAVKNAIQTETKKDADCNPVPTSASVSAESSQTDAGDEIRLKKRRGCYATVTDHRYYSIGSYERIHLTEEFFKEKKVVFLDRDGTLNVRPPQACYVEKPDDFVWLPGAIEAIKKLKEAGCITVLISNQPGIARGRLTEETLSAIHDKMQTDLRAAGCEIDHIYYCPHNWDEGCDCRKPKPGLIYQAQKDLSIDLTKCVLFGDDERDIIAGEAAGCKSVLVSEDYPLITAVNEYLHFVNKSKYRVG